METPLIGDGDSEPVVDVVELRMDPGGELESCIGDVEEEEELGPGAYPSPPLGSKRLIELEEGAEELVSIGGT